MWNETKRIVQQKVPSLSIDLSDVEEVRLVERGSDRSLLNVDDTVGLLELNLDALDDTDRREFVSEIVESFESQHRLFSGDPNKLREATEDVLSQEEVDDTVDFFDDFLSGPYLKLIERSLSVNLAWRIQRFSSEKMDDYKEDIAEDYAEHAVGGDYNDAFTAIHIASSGYFDEDKYMRTIFEQLSEEYEEGSIDYPGVFNRILQESPFLIVVGDKDRTRDVVSRFVRKLANLDSYRFDIRFIDGRGQGGLNRETLEEAILVIQRDAETLNFDCTVKPGETVYRVYPESISGLSLEQ